MHFRGIPDVALVVFGGNMNEAIFFATFFGLHAVAIVAAVFVALRSLEDQRRRFAI
jgi:hypothetical protein